MKKQTRVYERSPLNCAHPAHALTGSVCSRCGSREVPTFKPAPVKDYIPQPFTDDDAAYFAEVEREALAARAARA